VYVCPLCLHTSVSTYIPNQAEDHAALSAEPATTSEDSDSGVWEPATSDEMLEDSDLESGGDGMRRAAERPSGVQARHGHRACVHQDRTGESLPCRPSDSSKPGPPNTDMKPPSQSPTIQGPWHTALYCNAPTSQTWGNQGP
jgi:hypothetical protein